MSTSGQSSGDKVFMTRAVEATVRIGLLVMLATWCFQIIQPFIVPVVWGIIIAVAVYPAYRKVEATLNERRGLSAALTTLLLLVVLVVPSMMLADTLVSGVQGLADEVQSGTLKVPPPPESVHTWPFIGKPLQAFWQSASQNLASALESIAPQVNAFGQWLLSAAAGAGLGILQFVLAIIINGVLLAQAAPGGRAAQAIGRRLAGDQGSEFVEVAEATVRSVARGILGVALIQSILAGIGFLVVGVPGAGLWALVALLLSVIQIGILPVVLPIVIYVFYTADTVTAVIFLVWSIVVSALDNVLKPILLGRGVKVPMVIIFVGAIGGFITSGIIGLFIGAVILALGYKLFLAWLYGGEASAQQQREPELLTPGDTTADRA